MRATYKQYTIALVYDFGYDAPSDYRAGKMFERRVRLILNFMVARIVFPKELFSFRREMARG